MLANLLFKPIGLILGIVVAKKVGGGAFDAQYARRYGTELPSATTEQAPLGHVIATTAARAAVVAATATVFTRAAARGFRHVTGFWPGEQQPQPAPRLTSGSSSS